MKDHVERKRMIVILVVGAALFLPLVLAIAGGWMMVKGEPKGLNAAQSEALRQALERTANTVLPSPTLLGGRAIIMEMPLPELEEELQRVIRLAKGFGGSASSWNDGQSVKIFANVPTSAEALFRDSVQRGVFDMVVAGESSTMVMVEVVLRPEDPTRKTPQPPS